MDVADAIDVDSVVDDDFVEEGLASLLDSVLLAKVVDAAADKVAFEFSVDDVSLAVAIVVAPVPPEPPPVAVVVIAALLLPQRKATASPTNSFPISESASAFWPRHDR